jgi:hypothetical protein
MFNGLRENKKKIPRIEKSVKNEKTNQMARGLLSMLSYI